MRILIVENEPVLASITAEVLRDEGHQIIGPAYDLTEALWLAYRFPMDVAFVDIDLNGHEEGIYIANFLRVNYGVHSLFITANLSPAYDRGSDSIGVLRKPYTLTALLDSALITQSWIAGERSSIPNPRTLEIFKEREVAPTLQ